jgi:hypothetical protein
VIEELEIETPCMISFVKLIISLFSLLPRKFKLLLSRDKRERHCGSTIGPCFIPLLRPPVLATRRRESDGLDPSRYSYQASGFDLKCLFLFHYLKTPSPSDFKSRARVLLLVFRLPSERSASPLENLRRA